MEYVTHLCGRTPATVHPASSVVKRSPNPSEAYNRDYGIDSKIYFYVFGYNISPFSTPASPSPSVAGSSTCLFGWLLIRCVEDHLQSQAVIWEDRHARKNCMPLSM